MSPLRSASAHKNPMEPQKLKHLLWSNLMLGIVCALLGTVTFGLPAWLGVPIQLEPLPGIALAAVLSGGLQLLPGLWAGALLAGLTTPNDSLPALLLAPTALALQAAASATLARRLRIWPSPLDSARQVLLLILVVAPLGSLLQTTLMLPVLWPGSPKDWGDFWGASLLGVLLLTPPCLALWARPESRWEARRSSIGLPLLITAILCCSGLLLIRHWEDSRFKQEFGRNAEIVVSTFQTSLQSRLDIIQALHLHVALSAPQMSSEDWEELTAPWLARHPAILNLTWNVRVTRAALTAFETSQHAAGRPDFSVRDRDALGLQHPPGPQDELFPVTYVAPLAGNTAIVGMNPASNPASGEAIRISRRTLRPAASNPFPLAQEPEGEPGIVIYQAVFPHGDPARGEMLGLVSSALRIGDLVANAREQLTSFPMKLCLLDLSLPPEHRRLVGPASCQDWGNDGPLLQREVLFADRHWRLMLHPAQSSKALNGSWACSIALGASILFSGLLASMLLLFSGRARRTAEQVRLRTAELARASARLRDQQSLLTQAQRIAHMGSWELTAEGGPLLCSEELLRLLEQPPDTRLDEAGLLARLTEDDRPRLATAFTALRRAPGAETLDCRMLSAGAIEQILHFHIESEWSAGHWQRLYGTVQNVTQTREAEAHIQFLARFDSLTGLPNRNYWLEQVRAALQTARRHGDKAAMLFLDLDHFKTINDSLGHSVGDMLLTAVARRLRDSLRTGDILGRQGGDEFVLMLPRIQDMADITSVAAKLVRSLAEPFRLEGHELAVSASIGIACFPDDADQVGPLLKHADLAMYSAKQNGRNNFQFFVPEMNARAMQRLQLESALRLGIDRGELVLHFQPQLDLASDTVVACEALVRWQHPELGMVPPARFIPLAEESGLILPLGEWVLRQACHQQVRWKSQGLHLTMAINIAALQFQQADFVQRVARVLEETGADPADIELEITEGALLASTDTLIERLGSLRKLGMSLALDDFGTGYSCLAYLKRLPIERLKIDRSFIRDLPGDAEDSAIASATLSMARDLGLKVTAEGVESKGQREWLTQRGCQLIQGYHISRPLEATALKAWLHERTPRIEEQAPHQACSSMSSPTSI